MGQLCGFEVPVSLLQYWVKVMSTLQSKGNIQEKIVLPEPCGGERQKDSPLSKKGLSVIQKSLFSYMKFVPKW